MNDTLVREALLGFFFVKEANTQKQRTLLLCVVREKTFVSISTQVVPPPPPLDADWRWMPDLLRPPTRVVAAINETF